MGGEQRWSGGKWLEGEESAQEGKKSRRISSTLAIGSTTKALFRSPQNSNFLHSLSITSILGHMHGAVNVCKKITNCTV
jgi:hypothetical protein